MRKWTSVGGSGHLQENNRESTQPPTLSHRGHFFLSLKVDWGPNTSLCVCILWKRHRVSGGSGNAHLAEQKAERPADCLICQSKKRSAFGAASTLRRRQRERKRKTASGGKEKRKREVSWICFPNAVTFLAAPSLVLAKRGWEEEGWERWRERADCFSFFFLLLLPHRLKVYTLTL